MVFINMFTFFRQWRLPASVALLWLIFGVSCSGSRSVVVSENPDKMKTGQSQEMAENYYLSGALYDFEENYANAIQEYKLALNYDTSSAQIHKAIGRNYVRLEQHEKALEYLEKSYHKNPEDKETLHYLAETHYTLKEFRNAAFYYELLNELDPFDETVYRNLAYLYNTLGELNKLITLREKQLELVNWEIETATQLWSLYLQSHQEEKALEMSAKLVELFPDDPDAWLLNASSQEFTRDTTAAIESYRQLLLLDPENERALNQMYTLFAQSRGWDGLDKLLTDLLDVHPESAMLRLFLGEVKIAREQFAEAKALMAPLLASETHASQANMLLGRLATQQQNFEAAKGYFREITRRSPWDARAWEFLSVLYFQEGQPDSVILLLEEGLISLPNEFSLLSLYGNALQQVNRISEAVDPLEKAHRLEPEDFNTIVSLGIVYDELKMYQPLDSLYQSALARFPNNALLLNNYSYSLSVRDVELEKALEMSQKALQNEPDNAAYYDTAGWIYFKMGDLEKARELIEQSLVMEPDNPEVIEHLGDVYEKLGNHDLAKQYWQQALEIAPDNPELREKWLQN